MMRTTIVVSAVNLNHGGTLTILRDCLSYLSSLAADGRYRIVAIVFDKELAYYPNIEYIEDKWPKKMWVNRLWYEYVSMYKLSKLLGAVDLWFSLHDTSPNVIANKRAVYCHNPFAFYNSKWKELFYTPKIVLFSWFTKYIYQINQHQNNYIVVQQKWFKEAMINLFKLNPEKVIIAPPEPPVVSSTYTIEDSYVCAFLYASSPNSHKNFEILCRATEILEKKGIRNFKVSITLTGSENKYAQWLYKNWGYLDSLEFIGFLNKEELFGYYESVRCLVFPSKVETWGLPISEFAQFNKPMLLADLPYAYETAAGAREVGFFNPDEAQDLAEKMEKVIKGDYTFLKRQGQLKYTEPKANSWQELFKLLLNEDTANR